MAIFISYNRKDSAFVDSLAMNLVAAKHHVWMDRWELALGDSLTRKIEGALTKANAILVILSNHSVESEWCKRELSAGLIRELEEKQTLVMPCVIDNCSIPLFLKDKLYADFRRDPDEAFNLVNQSLARFSNPLQGRAEQPRFNTDWAVDWHRQDPINDIGTMVVNWVFVDHGHDWPYVILSKCTVLLDEQGSSELVDAQKKELHGRFLRHLLQGILDNIKGESLTGLINDAFERNMLGKFKPAPNRTYVVFITYRRMGADNGMDTLVHLDNNLRIALDQMDDKLFTPVGKKSAR